MPRYTGQIGVGDVLVTREGHKLISGVIRLGAWLRGRPAGVNHVIVAHHTDAQGRLWGIEGRPGGVGWRDLTAVAADRHTHANTAQPRTEAQRYLVAVAAEKLLGTPYDWDAIRADARQAMRLWTLAKDWGDAQTPGQVVCSSFSDWCYEQVGLPNPGGNKGTRFTTPGDWAEFITHEEWTDHV